jgi:hypothetical protein
LLFCGNAFHQQHAAVIYRDEITEIKVRVWSADNTYETAIEQTYG